jgi:hypothetical protein
VVIFLFVLEALLTKYYRVLSCAFSSSPKLQAAFGYYTDQTQFLLAPTVIRPVSNTLLSTCGPWENTALLKCRHLHCVALSFYIMSLLSTMVKSRRIELLNATANAMVTFVGCLKEWHNYIQSSKIPVQV